MINNFKNSRKFGNKLKKVKIKKIKIFGYVNLGKIRIEETELQSFKL
jgi:hypothetical protein